MGEGMAYGDERLKGESQDALINFLNVDIDLCTTMLETARLASHRDHYEQGIDNARKGITTIRGFMDRIQDETVRLDLEGRVGRLQAEVENLEALRTAGSS